MDLSIIIVNYNTCKLTTECVRSVYEYTTGITFEVIVVDNGSSEEGIEGLKYEFPNLILVKSSENIGFARGNNLGISHSSGAYLLLLNSDTYLKENAILATYNYIKEHPEIGVVSPRLVYPNGTVQGIAQRFPSVKYQLFEFLRLQKLLGVRFGGKILLGSFFSHTESTKVDWVWGAFFLFPRSVLEKLPDQKLDETYFMYWEDVQWSMDIKKLGYEIHFFAGAEVVHIHNGSKGSKNELMVQSGDLFFKRNYSSLHHFFYKIFQKILF